MTTTSSPAAQAGSYPVGDLDLNRIGYGAMQLAGPGVLGPPPDRAAAIEVLRTAVELGVNHIDTADAYGPYITNEIIREALFPYGDRLHIATKVGVVRDDQGGWIPGNSPQFAFFCNLPQYIKEPYYRFIENKLRENFEFSGSPVQVWFRQK